MKVLVKCLMKKGSLYNIKQVKHLIVFGVIDSTNHFVHNS